MRGPRLTYQQPACARLVNGELAVSSFRSLKIFRFSVKRICRVLRIEYRPQTLIAVACKRQPRFFILGSTEHESPHPQPTAFKIPVPFRVAT